MFLVVGSSGFSMSMLVTLLGGLALFLFGMEQMTGSLKIIAGERLRSVLKRLTSNRFAGVAVGAFVTSIIQSSSVTTVLVVGFVSAGLMTLQQAIGVIMGAGIGTTITAQIIAFKITKAALALVAVGFAATFLAKKDRIRQYGTIVFGAGLVFFGMNVMADATIPLRESPRFIEAAQRLDNALLGILLSAAFTAIVQSSSATTVLIIVLASQGLITLEQAIPLVFGANIGTCVTALLASIGKPREAVRAAFVHVIFNVLGVLLWFGFMDQLAWIVQELAHETPRQIAHAHTLFNVANTCVFIWFTSPLATLITWLVPDRPTAVPETAVPKFLDVILLRTPDLAIDTVRMELGRLGVASLLMVRGALNAALHGTAQEINRLEEMDEDVDALHGAVVTYLGQLSQQSLSDRQSARLRDYLLVANYFENIGDLIESQLVPAGRQRLRTKLVVSPQTEDALKLIHHEVCWAVEHSIRAVVEEDVDVALQVTEAKTRINELVQAAEEHLSRRLTANTPQRLVAYRLESEMMEYLKRVYYFAKRIARLAALNGDRSLVEESANSVTMPSDPSVLSDGK
ncbi:MAG: Na/Pi cotransporter family protein [Planctomycetales bacterium]|nr:Na/Pi cotransporter family protein [Planctomycetales bacterium]